MQDFFPFTLPFIRWADFGVMRPHAPTSLRRIYDHEFVYVLDGIGTIEIEAVRYPARADRLFLIQPRTWHAFHSAPDANMRVLGVHFDWAPQHDTLTFPIFSPASEPVEEKKFREPRMVPNWNLAEHPFLEFQGRGTVRRAFEHVVEQYRRGSVEEFAREAAGALLAHTIFAISREARILTQFAQNTEVGADAVRRVQRARQMLEGGEAGLLSVEEVAEAVGWSGDHLRRMFRQVLGASPSQVQNSARLAHAQNLLRDEHLSIAEVAAQCGFDDPSHFARVFKKETGLTPRQYERLAKKL